ncbi:hypothetical protein GF312_19420 [Candidatus Poribacteria bacterium]|nr:hypothetical protein [Candidatus Poribacteria bacterium]
MRADLFLASLLLILSVLIISSALGFGIYFIVNGYRRKLKETRIKGWLIIIFGGVPGFLVFWPSLAYMYVEGLWFGEMGYSSVFWKMVNTPWWLFFKYGMIAAAFLSANFILAQRLCPIPGGFKRWATGKTGSVYNTMILVIVLVSIVMGSVMIPMWDEFLRYEEREPYTDINPTYEKREIIRDPQFGKDVSYYLFSLPVYNISTIWVKGLLWVTMICMLILYNFYRNRDAQSRANVIKRGIFHLSALWLLILVSSILRSIVNIHRLVYSQRGTVLGAGFTDVKVQIPVYKIYIGIIIAIGIAVIVNAFLKKRSIVTISIAIWVASYGLMVWAFPNIYQYIWVSPNESNWERDYIARNINYTRIAYDLHRAKISEITPEVATLQKVRSYPDTLKNVQLWDRRTVRDTLSQIQVFRPFYVFHNVDADRYHLTNPSTGEPEYRQVMISARELDSRRLPSRTWVTLRLIYTHGYGVCLGPVNQFTNEGLPYLWVKGIPPEISYPEFNITRPEIYYGEVSNDYVFVNTKQLEFDHPEMRGPDEAEDRYTTYEGEGGVQLKSFFRRVLMALRFWDFRIVTSENLETESRIMFHRQVERRSINIAPFLYYDKDPYVVIGDSGKLWWVIDAYVTSKYFPYSETYKSTLGTINYIRNPLKAVIDAYSGQVNYYIWDENEVVNRIYRRIFPSLFKGRKDMPDGLDRHNRYPDDLTQIQAEMYASYHMRDPQTFYARGDQWELPYEVYHQNREQPMVPLYVMIRLPDGQDEEFVSIMPFTPYPTKDRPNMVAWMTVRNDEPSYGEIMVYAFPKGQTVPGPAQIESRIDTNPEISPNLTLWNEGGSKVIRGNLLTIPVGNALFYVEPLYLQDESIKMPLLRQVIVAAGDEVAWANNFDMAIRKVFEVGERIEVASESEQTEEAEWVPRSLVDIIDSAKTNYSDYKTQLQSGNQIEATKYLEALGKNLREMERYKKLLSRNQADILEALIKNLPE